MALTCPHCDAPVPERAKEASLRVAQCPECKAVFGYESLATTGAASLRPHELGLVEVETIDQLAIRWRWFRGQHVGLAIFALFWNSFLVFWYVAAFASAGELGVMSLVMILFPILHVLVGISVAYGALVGFVNHTELRATRSGIQASSGPLPWFEDRHVPVAEVARLTLAAQKSQDGDSDALSWDLVAELENGSDRKIHEGLHDHDRAQYLAHRLSSWLDLDQGPVSGADLAG